LICFVAAKSRALDVVSVERLKVTYNRKRVRRGNDPAAELAKAAAKKSSEEELPALTESAEKVRENIGHAFALAQQLEDNLRGVRIKKVEIVQSKIHHGKWRSTILIFTPAVRLPLPLNCILKKPWAWAY